MRGSPVAQRHPHCPARPSLTDSSPSGAEKVRAAHWSPDSRRIAVAGGGGGESDFYAKDDGAIKIVDVEDRTLMQLVSFGGDDNDAKFDDVAWYNDGSCIIGARHEGMGEMDEPMYPLDVYKVPSREVQQSLFQSDDAPGGYAGSCGCCELDEFDNLSAVSYGPRYECSREAECCRSYTSGGGEHTYFNNDLFARKGSGYGENFQAYVSSKQTLKCEEIGYCPAISQGRLAGIDRHSSEHIVYIR